VVLVIEVGHDTLADNKKLSIKWRRKFEEAIADAL